MESCQRQILNIPHCNNFFSIFFFLHVDTPLSGAVKGLIEGGKEYFKQNPADAMKMGAYIANVAKITPDQGIAFSKGFLETAMRE